LALGVSVTLHGALFTVLACLPAHRDSPGAPPEMRVALGNPLTSKPLVHHTGFGAPKPHRLTEAIKHPNVREQNLEPTAGARYVPTDAFARPLLDAVSRDVSFMQVDPDRALRSVLPGQTEALNGRSSEQKTPQSEESSQATANKEPTEARKPSQEQIASSSKHAKASAQQRQTPTTQPDRERDAQPSTPSRASRGGVEKGVDVVDLPRPTYPARCVRLGQQGTVLVRVRVGTDGGVQDVHLHRTSGVEQLDEAALEAARNGRFKPAKRDGKPIEATIMIPFAFELQ